MADKVTHIKFNNGLSCPVLGLGTWQATDPGSGEVGRAICDAIDIGYRHLDCAHLYGNEKEIGEAIHKKIAEGVVKREDLFITSKLWNTYHHPDWVEKTLRVSLRDFKLDYLDLYLIHWPMAYKEGDDLSPADETGKFIYSDVDYVDTWKAMEKLVEKGLVKSIGISNFTSKQTQRVLDIAKIKPVMNQIESHPFLFQRKLLKFCTDNDIIVTAYGPLGSPYRPWGKPGDVNVLESPIAKKIAAKYNKTVAQVVIRLPIDRGMVVIPKSVSKTRLQENFNIWDFKLTQEEIEQLGSHDCGHEGRLFLQFGGELHKDYPFPSEDDL